MIKRAIKKQKVETFLATRSAFAGDFKFTSGENPKSPNSITVAVAGAPTRHLHVIIPYLHAAYIAHLLIAEHRRHHTLPLLHSILHLSLYPPPPRTTLCISFIIATRQTKQGIIATKNKKYIASKSNLFQRENNKENQTQ